ncbi:hypothetical protein NDU88_000233 [Pleurodeles waltl]|uniref:Uncharacterized protein n=1 Tax=Pleurodeles waltl TaxID=8319 RepID=A0AAV7KLQ6_PLEWA|nr:hypothetical protein NDU88_000233 [Pleurodeles waltl]
MATGYPMGTAGDDPEGECVGNPDIWIPLTINDGLLLRPDARRERNAEGAKRRLDPSPSEHRRLENLNKKGTSDEMQGGPET